MSAPARRRAAVLVALLAFAGMLLLNSHTPLMMDDYDYSFSWSTGELLAGVGDIVASQAAHYRLWGGRSVTHFLAQLFLYLGKPVFNAANAAMYVCLLLEIHALARPKGRLCPLMLLAAHVLLMTLVPFFGVVFLWLDGACNYLWGTVLALLPLVIARSEREGGFFDADGRRGLLSVPVCLIAGWTNENTACGVLAVTALLLVWDGCTHRRVRGWRIAAAAAQALGVALMLLAPGNFVRPAGVGARGFAAEMLYRFAVVSYCLALYAGVLAALLGLALWSARRRHAPLRGQWLAVLCAAAFLSAYALVGSPQISDRSFTAVVVLVLAALLSAAADLGAAAARPRAARYACAALTLAAVLLTGEALHDVRAHEAAWQAQVSRIEAAAAAGEERVTAGSVPSCSRFTMDVTLAEDAQQWPNSTLSKVFGIPVYGGADAQL